ncbi:Uncharacterised protein [Streptococcus pneumoniae]|nr:Uncharacterised protein [Streptococcus pneumoniae]
MTVIHQKVCSVFFWCDWVVLRFTDHFDVCDVQLIAKFRTFVLFDNTCHINRRFLAQAFDNIKLLKSHFFTKFFDKVWFKSHTLKEGCSITQL